MHLRKTFMIKKTNITLKSTIIIRNIIILKIKYKKINRKKIYHNIIYILSRRTLISLL